MRLERYKMPRLTEEKLNEIIDHVTNDLPPIKDWFPTEHDAEVLCSDMEKNFEFLIWITDSNPDMKLNAIQKSTQKYIRKKINESIEFIDNTPKKQK